MFWKCSIKSLQSNDTTFPILIDKNVCLGWWAPVSLVSLNDLHVIFGACNWIINWISFALPKAHIKIIDLRSQRRFESSSFIINWIIRHSVDFSRWNYPLFSMGMKFGRKWIFLAKLHDFAKSGRMAKKHHTRSCQMPEKLILACDIMSLICIRAHKHTQSMWYHSGNGMKRIF